jgi:type I restriction enzyme M protein
MKETKNSSGANLGFEEKMWKAADKLRNNMDAAEYKHVVLGLIFLKYISDTFKEIHDELKNDPEKLSDPEDVDEYRARNVFWVPPEARWDYLQKNAKQPTIGIIVAFFSLISEFSVKEDMSLEGYASATLGKLVQG